MTLRLLWRTQDPAGAAWRLASAIGGRVDEERHAGATAGGAAAEVLPLVPLINATVAFVGLETGVDRLELPEHGGAVDASAEAETNAPAGAEARTPDAARGSVDAEAATALRGAPLLLGLGWATVDAARAIPGIGAMLGIAPDGFRPGAADETLGAAARVARLGPLMVVVLEPSTEGRVAAALARCGEGPCALYVGAPSTGESRPGPLGPGVLVMAERRSGPFVLALRRRSLGSR